LGERVRVRGGVKPIHHPHPALSLNTEFIEGPGRGCNHETLMNLRFADRQVIFLAYAQSTCDLLRFGKCLSDSMFAKLSPHLKKGG
jgi:hypothetical protein